MERCCLGKCPAGNWEAMARSCHDSKSEKMPHLQNNPIKQKGISVDISMRAQMYIRFGEV